ncbi:MAG: hypothetical protein R2849_05100 [Thermomicrobiales bacterium]
MFESPLFATGRPVAEAYWAEVLIAGAPTDVLMQCFERRCLTYNPSNPDGWQVEAGNVGLHYYDWRYGDAQDPASGNPPAADPPGDEPPSDPGPGNPPPGDEPPADPGPGDPPPGDEPPENPLPGDVPAAPYGLSAIGHVGGEDGPFVGLSFGYPGEAVVPERALNQTAPAGDNNAADAQPESFAIYRGLNETDLELYVQIGPDERRYPDEGVRYGERYCYYIVAVGRNGQSAPSETVCVEVPAKPDAPQLLSPPDGYTSYDREITFRWQTFPDATGYVICAVEPGSEPAHCDANIPYSIWTSGMPAANGETTVELHEMLAPEDERTELYWTIAACNGSAYDCGDAAEYRQLYIDLRIQLTAPALVSETVDPNDPRRFTFSWDLVQGAERYVVCAAEPGANCEYETGNYYKSSVLGPGVSTYPLTIPAFLAPDGQNTNLNWSAAACDAELNCVWQYNFRSFTVELAPDALTPPVLASPADGYETDASPVTLSWNPVDGAASYRVCLAYNAGDSCPYNQTTWTAYLDSTTTTWAVYTPDPILKVVEWTVAACDESNDCVWQEQTRTVTIDRTISPQFGPPALVDEFVDPTDPARFTFKWNLVQGAERYIICVAEPGANCENETGAWYKSSVLGAGVDTFPMDIPLACPGQPGYEPALDRRGL